ncbi:MAG: hypothetical protein JOY64_29335 [Alphaproteobacteria bacterium]|nr:hypothetical protein [Alphaproteobacteria bacterium]
MASEWTEIFHLFLGSRIRPKRYLGGKLDRRPSLRFRAAKAVWQTFQPDSVLSAGRLTRGDFSFLSERLLGDEVKTNCYVRVWRLDDAHCAMTVHMGLYDRRVSSLESTAIRRDVMDLYMLSFDVMAASSLIDGQGLPDLPTMSEKYPVEEFARLVADYSQRIDRIWRSVGGCTVDGLGKLAVWALRNRERVGTFRHGLGPACAAFVYGENELAHALLDDLTSTWEDPGDQVVSDMYDKVREEIETLLEAVKSPTMH